MTYISSSIFREVEDENITTIKTLLTGFYSINFLSRVSDPSRKIILYKQGFSAFS